MLGIGLGELIVVAIVSFIAIGPKHLPAVMRKIALFYRQFLSLREDLKFQMMNIDDQTPTTKASEIVAGKILDKSERE